MQNRWKSIVTIMLDIFLMLILALTSFLAFRDVWSDGSIAKKTGEYITIATIFIYGTAGVIALIGLLGKKPWAWIFVIFWAAFSTLAAGLATVVYGEQGIGTGLVAAASALLLVGFPCLFWARKMAERQRNEVHHPIP